MKRIISFTVSLALMLTLVVTAFASETVKFKVNVLSETDTTAVVSVDYEGGPGYNALDMQISFSSRLTITDAKKGDGLKNFVSENENAIASSNIKDNSLITAFASIDTFKVVKGNDLYKITVNKSTSAKLTKSDVKVSISNCAALKSGSTDVSVLSTSVSYEGFANVVTTTSTTQKTTVKQTTTTKKGETTTKQVETTTKPGETTTKPGETTSVVETTLEGEKTTLETSPFSFDDADGTQADTENTYKKADNKKIIIVGAAAICCVIVIAAGIYYVVKKTKKDDFAE